MNSNSETSSKQPTATKSRRKDKYRGKPRKPRQGDGFFALGNRARLVS